MSRRITVDGIFKGTSSEHNTFIQAIESIMNGSQTGVTFVSSKTTTPNKEVFLDSFEWAVESANNDIIRYNLTLIEGATIS